LDVPVPKEWWESLAVERVDAETETLLSEQHQSQWKLRNYSLSPTPPLTVVCISQSSPFSTWQASSVPSLSAGGTTSLNIVVALEEEGPQRFHFALCSLERPGRVHFVLELRGTSHAAPAASRIVEPIVNPAPLPPLPKNEFHEAQPDPTLDEILARAAEHFPDIPIEIVFEHVENFRTFEEVSRALSEYRPRL